MKTTQFLANLKLWQGLFFSFLLLVSLNLNSQNVGDDLLANSNGMVDTSSGATGSGAGCFSWGGVPMMVQLSVDGLRELD